jgi:hypothetical protein
MKKKTINKLFVAISVTIFGILLFFATPNKSYTAEPTTSIYRTCWKWCDQHYVIRCRPNGSECLASWQDLCSDSTNEQ